MTKRVRRCCSFITTPRSGLEDSSTSRKAWIEGRLELAPMFRAIYGNDDEVVEEHEAM
jgi:hypothetical protein